jgi:phytoene dehydrogenase-like protein
LFEKPQAVDGRAITENKNGFRFNLGPRALYRGGQGVKVLRELGFEFSVGVPSASGGYVIACGRKHTFPVRVLSLLTTSLFGLPARLKAARLLATVGKIEAQSSVQQWLCREVNHPDVQRSLAALLRLATYANDPERQSAGAALAQLQRASASKVYYLDGGWQKLVDSLHKAAENAEVKIVTGARVVALKGDGAVRRVRPAEGTTWEASSVIIAASPQAAKSSSLSRDTPNPLKGGPPFQATSAAVARPLARPRRGAKPHLTLRIANFGFRISQFAIRNSPFDIRQVVEAADFPRQHGYAGAPILRFSDGLRRTMSAPPETSLPRSFAGISRNAREGRLAGPQ